MILLKLLGVKKYCFVPIIFWFFYRQELDKSPVENRDLINMIVDESLLFCLFFPSFLDSSLLAYWIRLLFLYLSRHKKIGWTFCV